MPEITVKGMSCEHCRSAALSAVTAVSGVRDAEVDLKSGQVSWKDDKATPASIVEIKAAIQAAGFDVE